MSKVRAIVLFTIVIGVAFGTASAKDTPFLQSDGTTDQVALFVPFLAFTSGSIDSAFSVSNILAAPDGIFPTEGLSRDEGSIEIYIFTSEGGTIVFETEDNTVGNGVLDDDGELKAGRTWTVLLSGILEAADETPDAGDILSGYAWVIANFDAAQGTATVLFPDFDFAQSMDMQPTITVDNLQGGIPVTVP
ncbi:MAG: hypothetical protein EHM23_29770 [Acidobacteria bacterium]|nr:MAG: hypothetical protein EHM23_29770 [Acidobacteriota bacterium]